jgi:NADH-quinone oxidoreductase subunit G
MPKLVIDNIEVEVPDGTNVLEAAKKVGVVIPHFCYHPALGSVGACRLCAMKFIEGPVKGVQVSCMVQAADGMVVSTTDGEAARLRSMVIEWLMMNHPHDCPVCDEGGMCLLQDYTVSGGHSIRRYKGKKRVFADQYLGEFIQHEMNRCIQCYRCARFYQDYAGGEDFGPMQIANRVYFGRFNEGWLESPFSGNLADVCPTGVLTDRTFRFRARVWDLETAPSVCPHCSLGCNVTPGGRYRELLRVVARENEAVNGWFICDRGRFGHGFASRHDRPYHPMSDGVTTTHTDAVKSAADRLFGIMEKHGPGAVAFLGSPRASVETNYALQRLAQTLGSANVCFNTDTARAARESLAVSRLKSGLGRSLSDIAKSDVIVAIGVDPVNEAPMLALMMRQARRVGAKVFVIDPRPVELPHGFDKFTRPLWELADGLPQQVEEALGSAVRPTVVAGTGLDAPGVIGLAADTAERLRDTGKDAGVFFVMSGPNSCGTALMSGGGPRFDDILEDIERGIIKALVVAESDPAGFSSVAGSARAALEKLDALVVLDHIPTATVDMADVLIPTPVYAEDDGIYINNEGRAQAFARAYTAGIPVNSMGPEAHPPREFFRDIPGGTEPAWKSLLELVCLLRPQCPLVGSVEELRAEIAASSQEWWPLRTVRAEDAGTLLRIPDDFAPAVQDDISTAAGGGLLLLTVDHTFGTEELSSYSGNAMLRAPRPIVMINTGDASDLGLVHGRDVTVTHGSAAVECRLAVSDDCAKGMAFMFKLRSTGAWKLSGNKVEVKGR